MYFYHGYALGVGSTVKNQQFTEPACALSLRGGHASTDKKFDKYGVKFSAHCEVSGTGGQRNGATFWLTQASVVIDDLRITAKIKSKQVEVLSAQRLEGYVISEHRTADYEPSTTLTSNATRSGFKGLAILGQPVTVEPAEDMFSRYLTFSQMEQDFTNPFTKDRVMACLVGRGLTEADANTRDRRAMYETYGEQNALPRLKDAVICSFVKKVNISGGGMRSWGPIIAVPDFGTIYLGEVIVWSWMRCLNLFRVELNSGGSISGGGAGNNGTNTPPGGGQD